MLSRFNYTVEPLLMATLNRGHLCLYNGQEPMQVPNERFVCTKQPPGQNVVPQGWPLYRGYSTAILYCNVSMCLDYFLLVVPSAQTTEGNLQTDRYREFQLQTLH